ncbi:cilia- and flagella-associated protein 44-like isoform X1 [Syngnathus typhle]|uniref:cilia- and flagella-associated protein 44-like isoform X1 n=1 Tax=Syngnathus typhle TaxID=161592 RepID=UPI002A6A7A3D|nr:cilia- and flagella-associated protein 44-like isoform X1 [Syngnathus typhle]XP_061148877.1 cilia- and flagella-associated protein 44-like isoform X1 [Syngnathus typhle]XP_061148878.1 cilia- and flagella-associated protein 44-like isoform X1 [Syngnathus typhle]
MLILLDVCTRQQSYLRSCSGGGIGAIGVSHQKDYLVVAEKGLKPILLVYKYPSLQAYRILRDGTELAFSSVNFNSDASLLASLGSEPDYMLTVWNWKKEEVMLRCKAISQEVYRVTFSPYNPGLLTSSGSGHIKFWKMASTFTGLKLEGLIGHFGKTAATDIEGYIELPDGKVLSGSNWGNLLLWDGNAIKVELCRKGGHYCHAGVVQPFALEDGQLMTFGSDGMIRGWDFETIDAADSSSENSKFELEPMNEMAVGRQVCLFSMVKSMQADSTVWHAQDSNGAIWKVDLSFTYSTPDPACLFSFHAGPINGLDVSKKSHLMATTASDRSVRIFDFLSKTELTCSWFTQGGTALHWAPPSVTHAGNLLVTGFEDGVVRLLELFDPKGLQIVTRHKVEAQLRLKQAFKPHNAPVTTVAYEHNGTVLATGSSDCTVFFFTVGDKYEPIGFVSVPGPVQVLEWSPHAHNEKSLLILCLSGHVVEVPCPDPETHQTAKSFQLLDIPRRTFRFKSIKSQIRRDEEIARRHALKEQRMKERQENELLEEEEEEEEEELPRIYIPDPPSPLYWGFFSEPGQFWISMGGYDSGFLYHCKFSENQDENSEKCPVEPFDFLPIHNADSDPIRSVTFSSNRQLMLCGMHSGSIRAYPLDPDDHVLKSMQAYWELSIHDSNYGHLRHICCSHDDQFVLTAGDDGNIFSFTLLSHEELLKGLQRKKAKVPSPRIGLENEELAMDIDDPTAYSIETAKQKLEKDRQRQEADKKILAKRKMLAALQSKFKILLDDNLNLPQHIQLTPMELLLDQRFEEQAEREKTRRLDEVQYQMSWREEHSHLSLKKLQDWFSDSTERNIVTVFAIRTDHSVSTYHIPSLSTTRLQEESSSNKCGVDETHVVESQATVEQHEKDSSETDEEEAPPTSATRAVVQITDRQVERLQKASAKAEQTRAKIAKRKEEWDKLYAEKPHKDCEDPRDVQAIFEAQESIGDLKLKTDKNFTVPKHLRMSADRKKVEMINLEDNIREKQTEMNTEIVALRDFKLLLLSKLGSQARQLQRVQSCLPSQLHRRPPPLPTIRCEEVPEKSQRCTRAILERYRALKEKRSKHDELEDQDSGMSVVDELEREIEEMEKSETVSNPSAEETTGEQGELREEDLHDMDKDTLLEMQDSLLEQMKTLVDQFDKDHMMCLEKVQMLDWKLKLANLRHLTLYQELLLLKEVDKSEKVSQDKLDKRLKEQHELLSELERCRKALELKRKDIAKRQEKEKSNTAAFHALLGDDNNFEEYLTKVYKKKIKRTKKKEEESDGEDEDSNDDFDDYENWDDDDDDDWDGLDGEGAVEECPAGCDQKLFDDILELRERRLDLEELLAEEKKNAEHLEKDCDALVKKMKSIKISLKAAEDDLEQVNREKQQKMNQLDVVVPLRLHQIEIDITGQVPSDLSPALVLTRMELQRLQERVNELEVEKHQQTEVYRQARQQHIRLIKERKEMNNEIETLEKLCHQLMMTRFGREVDMEVLQTLCANKSVAEMKQERILREIAIAKDIQQWDRKVQKSREALIAMTRSNSERLLCLNSLFEQKKELEMKLYARQKKIGKHLQACSRQADKDQIWSLQELVRKQAEQIEKLSKEVSELGPTGGHMLSAAHAHLPPLPRQPTPIVHKLSRKQGILIPGIKQEDTSESETDD